MVTLKGAEVNSNSKKPENDFYFVNIIRVVFLGSMTILVSIFVREPVLILGLGLTTVLSVFWYFWERIGLFPFQRYPRSAYLPTFIDLAIISFSAVFTGGIGSFIIGGYFLSIAVSSMNRRINHGIFTLAVSFLLIVAMGIVSYVGWLPTYNVFGYYSKPAPGTIISILICWLAIGTTLYYIIRKQTLREIELGKTLEAEKRRIDDQAQELGTYFYQSPLSIIVTERDGSIIKVSSRAEAETGYASDELVGNNPRQLKSGKTPPEVYTGLWSTINAGKPWHGEFINRTKSGEEYCERASISPIFDSDGRIAKFIAIKENITETKKAEARLRESEARYRLIAENTHDVIWRLDLETLRYSYISPSIFKARGLTVDEAMAETLEESLSPESYTRLSRRIDEARQVNKSSLNESIVEQVRQPHADGSFIDMEMSVAIIADEAGKPAELLGVSRDVSQRLKSQEQDETIKLLLSEYREAEGDCIWETDAKGTIVTCPAGMAEGLGKKGQVLEGTGAVEAFADATRDGDPTSWERLDRFSAALLNPSPFKDVVIRFGSTRAPRYWSLSGRPKLAPDGLMEGWRIVSRDVTRTIVHSEEMERLAWVDRATELGNREALLRELDTFFGQGKVPGILAIIHIENLKRVNAVFGQVLGNEALVIFARRIRFICGEFSGYPSRIDGAEFAIFMPAAEPLTVDDLESSMQILREPVVLGTQTVELEVRSGAAMSGAEVNSAELLFQAAEEALNHARSSRMYQTKRFDTEMSATNRRRNDILAQFQDALEHKEFRILYQPQVETSTGKLTGAEALVRWHSERLGLINPGEFIPIAEQNGYIVSLGAWIQFQACKDAAFWPEAWRVAVNVAAGQLMNKNFSRSVMQILKNAGLPPERLKIEITESSLIEESGQVREQLERLRSDGIRIALDDFGTGYSSLSYLKDLPIDELKIDQSFIRAMDGTERSTAIVATIIQLAKSLGLTTTAEGAETAAHADILKSLGCDYIQGYLYSRPVPDDELVTFGLSNLGM